MKSIPIEVLKGASPEEVERSRLRGADILDGWIVLKFLDWTERGWTVEPRIFPTRKDAETWACAHISKAYKVVLVMPVKWNPKEANDGE